MTKIDPILPLAVQIAEGRGQFAFFLGSGVSRAARIPSGWCVRQHTLKDLYRMQENVECLVGLTELSEWLSNQQKEKINEKAFEKWLEDTGFVNASYSSIIDALRPDKPQQREYLANFFAGKEPTEAHYALSRLVKREMVRVIITTNFDPLMEHALDAEGVSYSVVASDAELKDAEPREHCRCRIIKPHGDWQDLNLRNSDKEVAELPPLLENELREIFNRYGLVVMGYGAYEKERLVTLLKERSSPYGLYWLVRNEPEETAKEIVQRQNGRWIQRESADVFMSELGRKIQLFLERPESQTPEMAAEEFVLLLRQKDKIGAERFIDHLMRQTISVSEQVEEVLKGRSGLTWQQLTEEGIDVVLQAAESILAVGLEAIQHRVEDAFEYLLQWTLRPLFERTPISPRSDIEFMTSVVADVLFIGWGIFCLQRRQFTLMRKLFELTVRMESFKGVVQIGRLDQFLHLWFCKRHIEYSPGRSNGFVYEYAEASLAKIPWFFSRFNFQRSVKNSLLALIMQFDLVHSLWLSAQAPPEQSLNKFTAKKAFFALYSERLIEPLVIAIEQDYNFYGAIARDIFSEGVEEFREKLEARYARIKEIRADISWETYEVWPRSNKVIDLGRK